MNLAELRKQLIEWMTEVKYWSPETKQSWEDYIIDDPENDAFRMIIYTDNYSYAISVYHHEDRDSYLGCIAATRKPRAGEDWTRGNDLPDGTFSRETFDKIVRRIVGYELVAKVKSVQSKVMRKQDETITAEDIEIAEEITKRRKDKIPKRPK